MAVKTGKEDPFSERPFNFDKPGSLIRRTPNDFLSEWLRDRTLINFPDDLARESLYKLFQVVSRESGEVTETPAEMPKHKLQKGSRSVSKLARFKIDTEYKLTPRYLGYVVLPYLQAIADLQLIL